LDAIRAECKAGCFNAVLPNGVFEISKCPGAEDEIEKILANPIFTDCESCSVIALVVGLRGRTQKMAEKIAKAPSPSRSRFGSTL